MLFPKKSKSPSELVTRTVEALNSLSNGTASAKVQEKAQEDALKYLSSMKRILYGSEDEAKAKPEVQTELANASYQNDLIPNLISNMCVLPFEARKDVAVIFANILNREVGARLPTVDYISERKPEIITSLLRGYENHDVAPNCGVMLRACIAHEVLARVLLSRKHMDLLFGYVSVPEFHLSSDAFSCLKDVLSTHKDLAAHYLSSDYDHFFECFHRLLAADHVTRRLSLKLLSHVLLERVNFAVMKKYISSSANLKAIMQQLRDRSKNIQFEAFHVFKIFAANPNKSRPVHEILYRNKDKLIQFLEKFTIDKDDEQFNSERLFLIEKVREIEPAPPAE